MNFAKIWLPMCETSFEELVFVYSDGHSSHITSEFIALTATHGLYVTVKPSHASILLQVAYLGVNRFLKKEYEREYNALMLSCNVSRKAFDDFERRGCVVRSLNTFKEKRSII